MCENFYCGEKIDDLTTFATTEKTIQSTIATTIKNIKSSSTVEPSNINILNVTTDINDNKNNILNVTSQKPLIFDSTYEGDNNIHFIISLILFFVTFIIIVIFLYKIIKKKSITSNRSDVARLI